MKQKQPKKLLRIEQAMELLQCSRATIYRMLADRQIQAMKLRGSLRIVSSSVLQYQRKAILEFSESEQLL